MLKHYFLNLCNLKKKTLNRFANTFNKINIFIQETGVV